MEEAEKRFEGGWTMIRFTVEYEDDECIPHKRLVEADTLEDLVKECIEIGIEFEEEDFELKGVSVK